MGSSSDSPSQPLLPFPLFMISTNVEHYLLYDIEIITWLRRTHNILGVLVGTLPQFPQQNVFLGLPLELQPEEARLLVEKKLAYVVDDYQRHANEIRTMTVAQKQALIADLDEEGRAAAALFDKKKDASKEKALKRLRDENRVPKQGKPNPSPEADQEDKEAESLFSPPTQPLTLPNPPTQNSWALTPPTSSLPLPPPPSSSTPHLPPVHPPSYALFKHLHNKSYFLSPGLRFGCQFLVYPGDPLRFHSHFLAVALDWDEEIDLLDLVGGGRLCTGVKKAWMVGGIEKGEEGEGERDKVEDEDEDEKGGEEDEGEDGSGNGVRSKSSEIYEPRVRTFCIEWGGM